MIPARKFSPLLTVFTRYTEHFIKGQFHTVHLLGEVPCIPRDGKTPLIVCLNHTSWWDVMLGFYMAQNLLPWEWYAVMDERQLKRYQFFAWLGMIGVDRSSLRGAREFLEYSGDLLRGKERALWVTPQGEMVSNYARPLNFQAGIGHLATTLENFLIMTACLHYEFWNERKPEAFVSFSPAQRVCAEGRFDRKGFVLEIEQQMEAQLDRLLAAAQQRQAEPFRTLLQSHSGASPTFDAIRTVMAKLRGERVLLEHGDVETPQWKQQK